MEFVKREIISARGKRLSALRVNIPERYRAHEDHYYAIARTPVDSAAVTG